MPRRSPAPTSADAHLREAIVAAGQRLWRTGLIAATEGNLSIRLDAERLLITPTTRRKWELAANELVVVGTAPDAPMGARAPTFASTARSMPRARTSRPWPMPTCRHRWD